MAQKRSRKSKLVPRIFNDVDDEEAEVQVAKQLTLTSPAGPSYGGMTVDLPVEFCVQVEVEACDETLEERLDNQEQISSSPNKESTTDIKSVPKSLDDELNSTADCLDTVLGKPNINTELETENKPKVSTKLRSLLKPLQQTTTQKPKRTKTKTVAVVQNEYAKVYKNYRRGDRSRRDSLVEVKSEPNTADTTEPIVDEMTEYKRALSSMFLASQLIDQPLLEEPEIKMEIVENNLFDEADSSVTVTESTAVARKMVTRRTKKSFTCKQCPFEGSFKSLYQHRKECKPEKQKCAMEIFSCSKCADDFADFKIFLGHLHVHGFPACLCPVCSYVEPNIAKLADHVMTHLKSSFVAAQLVPSGVKQDRSLRLHQCRLCNVMVTRGKFFAHWQTHLHDAGRPESLPEDAEPLEPDVMDRVLSILQSEHTFQTKLLEDRACPCCGKHNMRKPVFKRHLIEHLTLDACWTYPESDSLKCQICAEGFAKPEGFKLHMRNHAALPLYLCRVCDKAFSDPSNYTKHTKVHHVKTHRKVRKPLRSHEKPAALFACEHCRKRFGSRKEISMHMKNAHAQDSQQPFRYDYVKARKYSQRGGAKRKRAKRGGDQLTKLLDIINERGLSLDAVEDILQRTDS